MASTQRAWSTGMAVAVAMLSFSTAHAVEPDKVIPVDADFVVFVNMRQILESPLINTYAQDKLKEVLTGDAQADNFIRAAGIKLKDIDGAWIAGTVLQKNQILSVVRGKFDLEKVHAAAAEFAKKNPTLLQYSGDGKSRVYEYHPGNQGQTMYATFSDAATCIGATSKEYLEKALKKESGAKVNKAMVETLEKIKGGKQSLWLAMVVTDELKKNLETNPQFKIARKLVSVTGSIDIAADLDLSVLIEATDADTAKSVAKQLDAYKALLGLLANNENGKPAIDLLMEKLKVKNAEKAATITLKVTGDELKRVVPEKGK
jgi:hypothetical protein